MIVALVDAHQVDISWAGDPEMGDKVKLQGADGTIWGGGGGGEVTCMS